MSRRAGKLPTTISTCSSPEPVFDAGIDNDIVDDDSILAGRIQGRQFFVAGNGYRALVFGPETTVRRSVLEKALEFANAGGTVVYFRQPAHRQHRIGP